MSETGKASPCLYASPTWICHWYSHKLLYDFLAATISITSQRVGQAVHHDSKTTEGLTLQWAGRKLTVVLRALGVTREPGVLTHWESCTKIGLSARPTGISAGRFFP